MKSIKSLLTASFIAIAGLTACGGADVPGPVANIKGGSTDEKTAIQQCIENSPTAVLGTVSVFPNGTSYDASADNGDFLLLGTKIIGVEVNMTMFDVEIEWNVDTTSPYFESIQDLSDTQKVVQFKFPTNGDAVYDFSLKSVKCGGAVSTDPQCTYSLNLKKPVYKHVDETIANLNACSAAPIAQKNGEYGYKMIKYDQKSPYWVGNNPGTEKDYYYVNVSGEMIYTAPDGNWGLLADGENIIEVYAGSGTGIMASNFPAINKKYVTVSANMGQYTGNIQLGFVTYIKEASAANKKTATINYQKINTEWLNKLDKEYEAEIEDKDDGGNVIGTHTEYKHSQLQNVPGMNLSSALVEVTGTYVDGSYVSSGKRFTFKIQVDDTHQVTIAYDYHVDSAKQISNLLKSARESGKAMTIKGTYRYNCSDSAPFLQNFSNPGDWQVVPFLAEHVAF